jgi:hypothetical protein
MGLPIPKPPQTDRTALGQRVCCFGLVVPNPDLKSHRFRGEPVGPNCGFSPRGPQLFFVRDLSPSCRDHGGMPPPDGCRDDAVNATLRQNGSKRIDLCDKLATAATRIRAGQRHIMVDLGPEIGVFRWCRSSMCRTSSRSSSPKPQVIALSGFTRRRRRAAVSSWPPWRPGALWLARPRAWPSTCA